MSEGSETTAFWLVEQCALQQDSKLSNSTCRNAIGGEKEYAKIVDTDAMENAKLFVCSNATGATNPPFHCFGVNQTTYFLIRQNDSRGNWRGLHPGRSHFG